MLRRAALLGVVVLSASSALAEETVRRELVDAGVHIPVLTRPPELVEFAQAAYPPDAEQQGLTASVRMTITINADGTVGEVAVLEPVGHGFDEAAQEAARRFKFTPAEVDGAPAPVQIEYVYHFVLQAPDAGVELDAGVPEPAKAHLKGRLLARGSRGWVAGALVRCTNWDLETSSDEEGKFDLEVPPGECQVVVVAADYKNFETTETLEPGELKEVNYYVRPKVIGYETVVKAQKEKKEVVRRTLTRAEVQNVPGTFGDPVRVIQNFPGVARAPFVLGQLIVRGSAPSQTLTFFDGMEIPLLFHLAGGPSVVNGEFLDKLDFYPGGFGARYGRAVGGVVDVQSRKGAADTLHGVLKVDLLDASIFLEAPLTEGVSVAAAFRRSYIDALMPLVLGLAAPKDPSVGSLVVLPAYWDYQVRLDVGARGKAAASPSTFSVFAFGSDDQLKLVASGAGRNVGVSVSYHTNFHRLLGSWSYRQGNTTFKLTPYLGLDLVSLDFGSSQLKADQYNIGLRQDLEVEATDWLTVRAGADIVNQLLLGEATLPVIDGTQYVGFPGADPKTTTQRITQKLQSFDGALYAEGDLKFWKFTVTPGVRVSQALINGQSRHAVDPRLWVRFQPFEGTAIKGSVGLYTQPPAVVNVLPPPFGTTSLVHEKAFQSSLGVSQRITDAINVDVTGFYNRRFDNVGSPGPTVTNPDGTITEERYANNLLGRAYGLEVLLRHEVTKNFFGWVAYTLSRSEERRAGSGQPYVLTTFDQTHILTLVASYRFDFGLEIGARFRYVTGRPTTPLAHSADIFSADSNSYSSQRGAPNSARIKDFNQLDLRVDKYFAFEKWTLDVYLDVQNVYNMRNVEAFFTDYRRRQEYDVPGLPILPVLGVKASF